MRLQPVFGNIPGLSFDLRGGSDIRAWMVDQTMTLDDFSPPP